MSRIAVVAGPDAGHALPALGVASALRRRGHGVRVYSGLGHDRTAAQHGLTIEQLPLLAPTEGDTDLGHRMWGRAGEMAGPLAASLRGWRPDAVVVDTLTRAGSFAAQLLEIPWLELIGHHLPDPAPDLPPVGAGRRLARTPWRRADDRRLYGLQQRSLAVGDEQAAAAARALGLTSVQPPALRLVATLPGLERRRERWPADAHVVGPVAVDPAGPALPIPSGDAPLIVVTDSTASGVDRSLGEVALRGLTHLDVRLAVTSAHLPRHADDRVSVGPGPHGPLLAAATLAVGFGGGGFISKAAAHGVPMVVVPLVGDQREAAARLRDSGAGWVLPLRRLSPRTLRWAIIRHLADGDARRAACRLADEAAQLGPEVAATLVEAVVAGGRPTASGPSEHLRTVAHPSRR